MKKIITILGILLLSIGLVNAVSQEELNEAKSLIDSKVACNQLFNEQLEIIGEYYMEQMHPGESHELMHKMMGLEEGSEAEEQFHINMAKTIYCDEGGMMGSGMMNGSMMGGNMMGMMPMMMSMGNNMMGQGMMGSYQNSYSPYSSYFNLTAILINTLLLLLIIVTIIWFVKLQRGK